MREKMVWLIKEVGVEGKKKKVGQALTEFKL